MNPTEIQELLKTSRTLRLSLQSKIALPILFKAIKSGVKSIPIVLEFVKVCTLLNQKNQLQLLYKNLGKAFLQKHLNIGFLTKISILLELPELTDSIVVPFQGWTSIYHHTSTEIKENSILKDLKISTDYQGCAFFDLYADCPSCSKQHLKRLKRTLVFSVVYLCPNCAANLQLSSKQVIPFCEQELPKLLYPTIRPFEQITTRLYKELNHPDMSTRDYSVYAYRGYFDYIYFISQAIADRVSSFKITSEQRND